MWCPLEALTVCTVAQTPLPFVQVSPDCKYLQTTATFELGEERFTCTGKAVLDPGYTAVMPWQAITGDENMPQLGKGDACSISEVRLPVNLSFLFFLEGRGHF